MVHSSRRSWMLPAVVAMLTAAVAALAIFVFSIHGGGYQSSSASPLPTACDNFAHASELFAQGGSAEALPMMGNSVLERDAKTDSMQILKDLMDACAAERAGS